MDLKQVNGAWSYHGKIVFLMAGIVMTEDCPQEVVMAWVAYRDNRLTPEGLEDVCFKEMLNSVGEYKWQGRWQTLAELAGWAERTKQPQLIRDRIAVAQGKRDVVEV